MRRKNALRLVPAIHRATHQIAVYLQRDTRLGITQAEAHILSHLWTFGDSTVAELHAAFGHRRSTLTSILDRLAARGFIRRVSSPADRRTFVIGLTAPGAKIAGKAFRSLEKLERKALEGFSEAELKAFSGIVEAVGRRTSS